MEPMLQSRLSPCCPVRTDESGEDRSRRLLISQQVADVGEQQ
jgi:hypothetical protein